MECKDCMHFETNENGYPCDHCKRLSADCEDDFFQMQDKCKYCAHYEDDGKYQNTGFCTELLMYVKESNDCCEYWGSEDDKSKRQS